MIAETVVVMTVLGCGNQTDACDFIAEPETTYVSQTECEAAAEKTLLNYQYAAYPVLVADCAVKTTEPKVVNFEPLPDTPNRFEQLRASADTFKFDPLGRAGIVFADAFTRTRNVFTEIGNALIPE